MIDVENKIFTVIYDAAVAANSACKVDSVYPSQTAEFPHVMAEQIDAYGTNYTQECEAPYAVSVWQIDVYSNDKTMRKTVCGKIAKSIDAALTTLNFRCLSRVPMQDITNGIYRLSLRYQVETDGTKFYRI